MAGERTTLARDFAHRLRGFIDHDVRFLEADLATPGVALQIGVAPLRIDILTSVSGVSFGEAWRDRTAAQFEGIDVRVIGKAHPIANERATGRPRDLVDVDELER